MLKVKKNDPALKIGELRALLRGDAKEKEFRGNMVKLTPLLRKRANLAISLIQMNKKKKDPKKSNSKAKPDYLDMDKDGDKKEPMKKAIKEAKMKKK